MTVLYILIGVFFVLLTGLNIYAYLTIVGMSRSYAELGFISRNFRFEFKSANDALQEILNGDKEKNLDKDVWKKAEDFIPTLKKLEPSLEDLAKNIEKFKETAQEAYQESDLNIKQQHFSTCERYYETSVQKLDIFESKIKDVIENEMGFVRLIYIILLSSNILVFGAIFYVVYQNNKQHLALSQKVTMENANLNAIMAGPSTIQESSATGTPTRKNISIRRRKKSSEKISMRYCRSSTSSRISSIRSFTPPSVTINTMNAST